ncbi:MAG: hypothetical protein RLY17_1014 [Pseudomonadota bacterium]|jgi:hypothetical protein
MTQPFDFEKVLNALQSVQLLIGKNRILTLLIKMLIEVTLTAELNPYLAHDIEANRSWQKNHQNPDRQLWTGNTP